MTVMLAMLALGILLGFVGAGGAGLMIAVLTLLFDVPVHTALGTCLGAMMFTTLSGVYSHSRQSNVTWSTGVTVGIFGAVGAFGGAYLASLVGAGNLARYTGLVQCCFAGIMYWRIFHKNSPLLHTPLGDSPPQGRQFWLLACITGLATGGLSGLLGVGATPLIQLSLLLVFHTTLYKTVGTSMLIIFPIALLGSLGYLLKGHFDGLLLLQVVAGQVVGVYVGARFTQMAPVWILKATIVLLPLIGGLCMIMFSR